MHDPAWRLIDARAPERFRGDVEPLDRVAGHIPGAANHFYAQNLADDGAYKNPADLHIQFAPVVNGVAPDHIVSYCGSGVTATQNLLALEHAGIRGAKLYAGSWSEWSSDPGRPVAGKKEP
jgi:thiosulfate/3-mercaptopyruvate sulfurtransferase